jgi:fermentation-respiration switch protein FrsA (DUF1100 family)
MSHGLESSKDGDGWPELASLLEAEGIASLRFTHRGCGWGREPRAEGRLEETTLSGRIADLREALGFLATANVDTARIAAVGCSFGGMVVLGARDPRVRALALVATPFRLPRANGRMPALGPDAAQYDLLGAAREYRRPLLIVHGGDDEVVPAEHAYQLYEAAQEPKRLEVLPGADHVFTQPAHRQRVWALCVEWMQSHLKGAD